MYKFNWDLIMKDNTCVKIKNYEQFKELQNEYKNKYNQSLFEVNGFDSRFHYYNIGNVESNYYNYRDKKNFFIGNDYTILKYKDVRVRKENIVCEKEDFKEWLKDQKEYTDFLVEEIIIKCIEYYNNKYPEKTKQFTIMYDALTKIRLNKLITDCQESGFINCKQCECDYNECFNCLKETFESQKNNYDKDSKID